MTFFFAHRQNGCLIKLFQVEESSTLLAGWEVIEEDWEPQRKLSNVGVMILEILHRENLTVASGHPSQTIRKKSIGSCECVELSELVDLS